MVSEGLADPRYAETIEESLLEAINEGKRRRKVEKSAVSISDGDHIVVT